jgi:hypothetical protein
MDSETRLGIILIIIGLLIPLAVFPFVSGFSKDMGLYEKFYKVGIEIKKDTKDNTLSHSPGNTKGTNQKVGTSYSRLVPQTIPFRYFFIPTVILIYIGIIRIERSRRKKHDY